jgi:hypothetical protein
LMTTSDCGAFWAVRQAVSNPAASNPDKTDFMNLTLALERMEVPSVILMPW